MKHFPQICTCVLVLLALLFAFLNKVWNGFAYFVLSMLLLLSVFWGIYLAVQYFTTFKKECAEKFKIFRAQKINKTKITSEEFDLHQKTYQKEFSKLLLKDKIIRLCIIIFCFAVAAAMIAGMIFY